MSKLKRGEFLSEKEKNNRNILLFFVLGLLALIILSYLIPKIKANNIELYKANSIQKVLNDDENYSKVIKGTVNVDEVKERINSWMNNLLLSSDNINYLYIEQYINSIISKYWQEFHFGETTNFVNSGNNDITIPLVFTNDKDLSDVLIWFSKDGYLGKNSKIEKQWNIYKLDLNLNFFIN